MMRLLPFVLACTFALSLPAQEAKTANFTAIAAYPLQTCVVSGKELDPAKLKRFDAGGREFRTCCGGCQNKVQKDPAPWIQKLDEAVKVQDAKLYPLDTCAVCTTAKLAGEGVKDRVLNGFLVRCCSEQCATKAEASKTEVLARVQAAAVAKQKAGYALKTCAVTNDDLDPKNPTQVLYGYQLMQLCCEDCIEILQKDPAKAKAALAKVSPAAAKAAGKEECCSGEAKGECCSEKKGEGQGECCSEKKGEAKGECCEGKTEAKPENKTNGKSEAKDAAPAPTPAPVPALPAKK